MAKTLIKEGNMRKIGLFGVTGNPPHLGHLKVVKEALKSCDKVWVSPVYVHPFNKKFIDYSHRLAMLQLMFAELENVKIVELDKEFFLKNSKIPYSYDLLSFIKDENAGYSPLLVIGEDNYKPNVWQKFYFYDKIDSEFGVIVVEDSGAHSTQIRSFCHDENWAMVAQECGQPIAEYLRINQINYVGA
jgi:nicotinate-nucleotide adenylyltransferase